LSRPTNFAEAIRGIAAITTGMNCSTSAVGPRRHSRHELIDEPGAARSSSPAAS
jgi:hypothetical protein